MEIDYRGHRRLLIVQSLSLVLAIAIDLTPLAPALAAFGDGTPTLPNANVFTSSFQPRADTATGAFTQHISLDIPPGRNGLQPDIALDYNSQRTQDSIVGYGWQLSIPYIQRLNKTGSQNLSNGSTAYFTSSIDGELVASTTLVNNSTSSISILDTLPVTTRYSGTAVTSDSFTYTVPPGGTNKLLVVLFASGADKSASLAATQNSAALTCGKISGPVIRAYHDYCYLAAPSSGVFSISWTGATTYQYAIFTVQNAAQTSPIDVSNLNDLTSSGTSLSTSVTTTQGNDLLLDECTGTNNITTTYGIGQSEIAKLTSPTAPLGNFTLTQKNAAASAGSEIMSRTFNPSDNNDDLAVIAIKQPPATSNVLNGTYLARVDDGSHNSYSFSGNTWTVYDKKGIRYLYGSSDAGRQYDTTTATSSYVYKWMLQEIRDTNNNYVKYTYLKDSNQIYPSTITYTGSGSTDGVHSITFATSTRPDVRQSYAPTFSVTTNYRVSEIDALANGVTVRKYLLGYGAGNNGKRSLLTSFQQQGYDENQTLTSLPAMTFTYKTSSDTFYRQGTLHAIDGQSWVVADTNGNGINDINKFWWNGSATSSLVYLEDSTTVNNQFTPPEYWDGGSGPVERGNRYLDVNGDGKPDLARFDNGGPGILYVNTYSTSTSWGWSATTTTGTIPPFKWTIGTSPVTTGIFGDVNGDGLPDYEASLPGYVAAQGYLGNGLGWDSTTYFPPAKDFPTQSGSVTASQLIDVNGDGLDDWTYSDGVNTYMLLNTGTGWATTPASQWTISTSTLYNGSDRGLRFFDINGDGLPDFVLSYSTNGSCGAENGTYKLVLLNTGNGWATSTAYAPAPIFSNCTHNEYANFIGNGQMAQDVLSTVTYSKGGATSVLYTPSTQISGNGDLPYDVLVATAIGTYDGRGNAATTTYSYTGGLHYLAKGVRDRLFAGFASSTARAPDSVTSTYFDQGLGLNTALGEQANGYPQISHPFRKDIFDISNNLNQKFFYRWDTIAHGDSTFVGLGRQIEQDYATDGTHRDKATDYTYSPTTDDLLTKIDYGEVTGNNDGTFTDIGTDKRTTTITYAASSSVNLSLPVEKKVVDNNSATTSDQKLYYDGLAFGLVNVGNNTRQEDWISGSAYASSTKIFNSYGLVATSTDRRGNVTGYVYDALNLFVATTTNPLSQTTQYTYNYANGKVKQITDPNNRLAKNIYDGIGRLTEVDRSDVTTPATLVTATTYTYTDNATPPSAIHRADYLTSTTTVDTYDHYDGLNRLLQERKASQYANTFAAADRTYNAAGELASQSFPYFSYGSSFTAPSSNNALFTNYTYDSLKRVLTKTDAVGTTTNAYAKWTTTTTDPNGNIKDYVLDAFGNLSNVVEHLASLATTTYSYDVANNLASTTDSAGNIRNFTYDGLGRRLSAQDLHAPSHGTFGTWNYAYDDAGNQTSQTDPKSQVVNRTFDALNRLLTEDYTGLAGIEVTNTYDNCTNGIGYLCTASSTSALVSNQYDILGRVRGATTTVTGTAYGTSYTYDRQGNVTNLIYPNGSQVAYGYNSAGLPYRAQYKPSGGSFSDIISNFDYAPRGLVTNALFGNGASTTYSYNANSLYRLTGLQTLGSGSTYFQNFAYTYDPVGNLTQIANTASSSANATTVFSYDQLNRLAFASTTAATSTPYIESFSYDTLGNILTLTNGATTSSATIPSILDTLPVTNRLSSTAVTSDSFTYTVPSGGQNKLLVVLFASGGDKSASIAATQNGASLTCQKINGAIIRAYHLYCYLAAPTSGTFSISWTGAITYQYSIFTLKDAAQSSPIDVSNINDLTSSGSSLTTSVTTTSGNDLLLDNLIGAANVTHTFGVNQTQIFMGTATDPLGKNSASYKNAAASAGSESMIRNFSPNDNNDDLAMTAVKPSSAASNATTSTYAYAATGYANPHAVTQIANGTATTTYAYDNNGNLTSANSTGYAYDYMNRLTSLGFSNSTTTYGYDVSGSRVIQTGTTSTTVYPSKFYSVISNTVGSNTYATTTEYIWTPSGDTQVATVEQQFASGVATGTAKTRYIHPDHLGSTNVVTDESGFVVETLDYYPYGATRINSTSGNYSGAGRQYVNRFGDQSGLDYLQKRYYDPSRGQFLTEDPVFLGDPKAQNLTDPQSLNSPRTMGGLNSGFASGWNGNTQSRGNSIFSAEYLADPQMQNAYGYSRDNPITNKDPDGNQAVAAAGLGPVFGIEALSGPLGWAAFGATALISGAYLYHSLGEPNWQTTQLVSGQGYSTDPNFPSRPPKGPWGTLAWTSVITAVGIGAFNDYFGPFLQSGSGPSGSTGTWTSLPPIVIQGGSSYYRNSSGLLSTTPQSGAGGSGGLPATVTQGGTTYYRNSSGLLSTSPGK